MKTCKNCKTQHDKTHYYKNKNNKDGLDTYCKDCRRAINKEYTEKYPNYQRDYYYNVIKPKRQAESAARRAAKSQASASTRT